MSVSSQGSPQWTRSCSRIPRYRGKTPSPQLQYSPLTNNSLGVFLGSGPVSMIVNHSFGSLEASGGDSIPQDLEQCDIQNKLSDLQHKNKILIEDSQKRQKQLETSEETVADLKEELDSMQKKIWTLQSLHERSQYPKIEIEDLKSEIISKDDVVKSQQLKIKDLEKQILVNSDDYDEMKFKYEKTKDLFLDLKAHFESNQNLLEECRERIREMESSELSEMNRSNAERLDELQQENEVLVSELQAVTKQRDDLECQNAQLQHQMVRELLSTKSVEVGSDSDSECSLPDTPDLNGVNHKIVHSTPLVSVNRNHSTPLLQLSRKHSKSLHAELKNALFDDDEDCQQSPLCERSMDNIHSISILEQSLDDSESQFSEMRISLVSRQKDFARKLLNEFNFAKNALENDVESLLENAKNHVIFERPTSQFKTKFNRVMSRFTLQLEKMDIVNDNADIVLGNLMQFVGKLQCERNQLLHEKQTIKEHIEGELILDFIVDLQAERKSILGELESQRNVHDELTAENVELRGRIEELIEKLNRISDTMSMRQTGQTPDLLNEAPSMQCASDESNGGLLDTTSARSFDASNGSGSPHENNKTAIKLIQSTTDDRLDEYDNSIETDHAKNSSICTRFCLFLTCLVLAIISIQIFFGIVPIFFSGKLSISETPWFIDIRRTATGPVTF